MKVWLAGVCTSEIASISVSRLVEQLPLEVREAALHGLRLRGRRCRRAGKGQHAQQRTARTVSG